MQQKLKTSEEAATPDDYFNQVVILHSRETKGTGQQKRMVSLVTSQTIVHMLMILIAHVYFVIFITTTNKNGPGHFPISTSSLLKLANHTTTRGRCMICHTRQ